ncbi:hypothetical protein HanHA300_Chr15g0557081 [Helianthus annuus]|nr:hypothetical protein HanHA300_Chr15g0557081 [Helianthus annuus]KAJ0472360.1 hypothetical protein HanHA89_Chr15g0606201 [Helianthus annuus]KAJ0647958.1 hypothetical protein HanLR1_Chr15g0567531 [Helianthus annuus]
MHYPPSSSIPFFLINPHRFFIHSFLSSFMADPHDFVSDLQAYSPSRVFRNNFIGDESPMVYFHQASSSSARLVFRVGSDYHKRHCFGSHHRKELYQPLLGKKQIPLQ